MITLRLVCCAFLVATTSMSAEPTAPIQVLVLGTYHFGNPGQDLHNMKVESVLTPEKQAELADVAKRLAKFRPTKIAIEAWPDGPHFSNKKVENWTPESLTTNPDERVQIAFRLALQLGQESLYAIDEQSDTIDYFPYAKVDAYAKAHDQSTTLARLQEGVAQMIKEMEAAQKTTPIRLMLAQMNEPARISSEHAQFYYGLLAFGNEKEQPGATLNAAWYERNAKIFAKLTQLAKPGDRILVVFGGGHSFWLRHLVQHTPGYELVEPHSFLR